MAEKTDISWTDATFNPWWGCAKVSPACDHCYAERDSKRFAAGQVLWGVDAERRVFGDKHWSMPVTLNKRAAREGRRIRVFCASMADVFDKNAPEGARERLWKLIDDTPNLDWLLLTKRIGNARAMLPESWFLDFWPENARLGITVVNQPEVDRDVPKLLALGCPNFLSIEPMLGPINLRRLHENLITEIDALNRNPGCDRGRRSVEWVIVGGESGPHARAGDVEWYRSLQRQCEAAGTPFHMKQITENGRALPMADWPAELQVQQFPRVEVAS